MQHRAFDSLGSFFVLAIMLDVDGCRGSIFLTDSMYTRRIAIRGNVFRENIGAEGTLSEGIMENGFRSAEQIALRQRLLLRQQNPGPIGLREARIRPAPGFENRNHVE